MSRDVKSYTLLDAATPRAIASSTNATPIEITMGAAHGYTTGQKVTIVGHATNTNANGSWDITVTGANTFTLDGSVGNGVGGATGTAAQKSKFAFCADFAHAILSFDSDGGGTAAMTVKVVGSIQANPPDFARPKGPSNQYDYVQIIDLQDSVAINGNTGIVLATADINRMFEVNVNGLQWIAVICTAGTAGSITVKARLYNSD